MPRLGDSGRCFAHLYCAVGPAPDVLPPMGAHKCYGGEGFQERISRGVYRGQPLCSSELSFVALGPEVASESCHFRFGGSHSPPKHETPCFNAPSFSGLWAC